MARQLDGNLSAFAEAAADGETATMETYQPIGNGKTEARPLMAAAEALIHLAERFDEMRQMLLGDADAGVADRDARAFRRGGDRDPDAAFGRRELDPVAD